MLSGVPDALLSCLAIPTPRDSPLSAVEGCEGLQRERAVRAAAVEGWRAVRDSPLSAVEGCDHFCACGGWCTKVYRGDVRRWRLAYKVASAS